MFHRYRKHNKTLPSVHTERDGQSESDSQSQASDGASNASVVYRKAAQVRLRHLHHHSTAFLRPWFRMGVDSTQRLDSGFRLASYVGFRPLLGRSTSSHLFPQSGSPWDSYSWNRLRYLIFQVMSQCFWRTMICLCRSLFPRSTFHGYTLSGTDCLAQSLNPGN